MEPQIRNFIFGNTEAASYKRAETRLSNPRPPMDRYFGRAPGRREKDRKLSHVVVEKLRTWRGTAGQLGHPAFGRHRTNALNGNAGSSGKLFNKAVRRL
jgi:hypothetical protein